MNNLFADCDPADPLPSGYAVDHVSRLVLPQRIASALADERLASQVLLAREAQEAGDDARNLSPQGSSDSIGEAAAPVSTRKKRPKLPPLLCHRPAATSSGCARCATAARALDWLCWTTIASWQPSRNSRPLAALAT